MTDTIIPTLQQVLKDNFFKDGIMNYNLNVHHIDDKGRPIIYIHTQRHGKMYRFIVEDNNLLIEISTLREY